MLQKIQFLNKYLSDLWMFGRFHDMTMESCDSTSQINALMDGKPPTRRLSDT